MIVALPDEQFARAAVSAVPRSRAPVWPGAVAGIVALLVPAMAVAQNTDGEGLFRQRCSACHSIDAGQNRSGPHLADVIGRTAGSIEGARYSNAMRESSIVWNNQSLDAFLAAPRQLVPGTTMAVGVPDAAQRAAIIAYLESR